MEGQMRILHVLGRLDRGGAETMVMNLYRRMDRSRLQFDFVIHTEDVCDYTAEVEHLGGRIYSMEPFGASTAFSYRGRWRAFFREHPEYRVIHGHMRSTASLYFAEAKRAGLVTIAHSHNTSSGRGLDACVKNILQYPLRFQADYLFACSRRAGEWLYGRRACDKKNFYVLANGIEPQAFQFDAAMRRKMREEMLPGAAGQDVPVFFHVGRLERQKNHVFLLKIMERLVRLYPGAKLWLCGVGPLEGELRDAVQTAHLTDCVSFLGARTDVSALMQAADGMILPSLFEGLPVTLVEAQAAGLPVLMSDVVTREVILTDLVETMPLAASPECWAQAALRMVGRSGAPAQDAREVRRGDYARQVGRCGYDAKKNALWLSKFYEQVWNGRGGSVSKGGGI